MKFEIGSNLTISINISIIIITPTNGMVVFWASLVGHIEMSQVGGSNGKYDKTESDPTTSKIPIRNGSVQF